MGASLGLRVQHGGSIWPMVNLVGAFTSVVLFLERGMDFGVRWGFKTRSWRLLTRLRRRRCFSERQIPVERDL